MYALLARNTSWFYRDLWNGEPFAWITFGVIVAVIIGMAIAHKLGYKFPDKKARREALRKRKKVLWEYERDDN